MTTEAHTLRVTGLPVAVVRKPIKNLHLGVYPPDGQVRVAAPLAVSGAAVRVAVIGKLPWIHRQRASFQQQARQSKREMVSGESHYYLGRRYRLTLVAAPGKRGVVLRGTSTMQLRTAARSTAGQRAAILQRWYRERLRELAAPLVEHWAKTLDVTVRQWGIKRMKTKWGSCNPDRGRVWLNLELAKKPLDCLEYVVVHELVHLRARHHDNRFHELMTRHLPAWRAVRSHLNSAPLAAETWTAPPGSDTTEMDPPRWSSRTAADRVSYVETLREATMYGSSPPRLEKTFRWIKHAVTTPAKTAQGRRRARP